MSRIEKDLNFIRLMVYQYYKVRNPYAVTDIVRKYGMNYDDVMQIASIGYLKAESKYDESKGVKFLSYAGYCIKNELKEVTRVMNYAKRKVDESDTVSIHQENEEGDAISDIIPSKINECEIRDNRILVGYLLSHLDDKERYCVEQHIFHDRKQREIGKDLGITQKNVSVKIANAINKMKELVQ